MLIGLEAAASDPPSLPEQSRNGGLPFLTEIRILVYHQLLLECFTPELLICERHNPDRQVHGIMTGSNAILRTCKSVYREARPIFSPVEVPYTLCDGSGRAPHGSRAADYGLISSPKGVPYPHQKNLFIACSTIRNGHSVRHALLKWWAIGSDLLNEYPNAEKIVSANCITGFVTTLVLRDRCHRLFARLSRPSPNIPFSI